MDYEDPSSEFGFLVFDTAAMAATRYQKELKQAGCLLDA